VSEKQQLRSRKEKGGKLGRRGTTRGECLTCRVSLRTRDGRFCGNVEDDSWVLSGKGRKNVQEKTWRAMLKGGERGSIVSGKVSLNYLQIVSEKSLAEEEDKRGSNKREHGQELGPLDRDFGPWRFQAAQRYPVSKKDPCEDPRRG